MVYGYSIIADESEREAVEKELLEAGADKARTDIYTTRNALNKRNGVLTMLERGDVVLVKSADRLAISISDYFDVVRVIYNEAGAKLQVIDMPPQYMSESTDEGKILSIAADFSKKIDAKRGSAVRRTKSKKKGVEND